MSGEPITSTSNEGVNKEFGNKLSVNADNQANTQQNIDVNAKTSLDNNEIADYNDFDDIITLNKSNNNPLVQDNDKPPLVQEGIIHKNNPLVKETNVVNEQHIFNTIPNEGNPINVTNNKETYVERDNDTMVSDPNILNRSRDPGYGRKQQKKLWKNLSVLKKESEVRSFLFHVHSWISWEKVNLHEIGKTVAYCYEKNILYQDLVHKDFFRGLYVQNKSMYNPNHEYIIWYYPGNAFSNNETLPEEIVVLKVLPLCKENHFLAKINHHDRTKFLINMMNHNKMNILDTSLMDIKDMIIDVCKRYHTDVQMMEYLHSINGERDQNFEGKRSKRHRSRSSSPGRQYFVQQNVKYSEDKYINYSPNAQEYFQQKYRVDGPVQNISSASMHHHSLETLSKLSKKAKEAKSSINRVVNSAGAGNKILAAIDADEVFYNKYGECLWRTELPNGDGKTKALQEVLFMDIFAKEKPINANVPYCGT